MHETFSLQVLLRVKKLLKLGSKDDSPLIDVFLP